jgi:hypothetical protein
MVSPISPRAVAYVRKRATAVMQYTCRIERIQPPTYNTTSLLGTPGSRTTIYEGVCRVWETSGGSPVQVTETEVIVQNTNLSIPWDVNVVPQKHDEVLITASPTDTLMVGKRFQIESSAKFGEMRATRRFNVVSLEKKAS